MAHTESPEPRFELLKADDYTQYLLRETREIVFVLRQLASRRANITAYLDEGQHFFPTSIVEIEDDERHLLLDLGPDTELHEKIVAAEGILCITQMDKVKIQFMLQGAQVTHHENFPALRAPLPAKLLRLQRREYYRLSAPSSTPLRCLIPVSPINGEQIDARVLDISGGGIAVVIPPQGLNFTPEQEYPNCRLELPEFGPITATLRIRNVFRLVQRNGVETIRAGCQFVDLSPATANLIQRYILKVERDRKLRGVE